MSRYTEGREGTAWVMVRVHPELAKHFRDIEGKIAALLHEEIARKSGALLREALRRRDGWPE
jgi:hypothetical protein